MEDMEYIREYERLCDLNKDVKKALDIGLNAVVSIEISKIGYKVQVSFKRMLTEREYKTVFSNWKTQAVSIDTGLWIATTKMKV